MEFSANTFITLIGAHWTRTNAREALDASAQPEAKCNRLRLSREDRAALESRSMLIQ